MVDRELHEFPGHPNSLRELIILLVTDQVEQYNAKPEGVPLRFYFREEEIESLAEQTGKVVFGAKMDSRTAVPEKAIETAIMAFQDGLFRVFHERSGADAPACTEPVELTSLDAPTDLSEGDTLTFIRLVMLAGRLW